MKLLRILFIVFLFVGLTYHAENPFRVTRIEGEPEKISEVELLVDGQQPLLREWLVPVFQGYLEKILGAKPPVVTAPSGNALTIVLGAGNLAAENGLDVAALPPEGYYIRRQGNLLFLCGLDDQKKTPQSNFYMMWFSRGTISAMYDFLERFADCIFAYPSELGQSLPSRGYLALPPVIQIQESPDFDFRSLSLNNPGFPMTSATETLDELGVKALYRQGLASRYSINRIPFGHGLVYMHLVERYAKEHPEYFALMPDGRRHSDPENKHPGHICYSNPQLREEIYQDLKAYLTGQPAATRGLKHWEVNAFDRKYVNVMPQDWFYYCCCDQCAKIAPGARFYQDGTPEETRAAAADAINEMLWKFTADMARRLTAEGIDGIVTQMAYSPLREPPKCDLPENIEVMVALPGQAHHDDWENELSILQHWIDKLHKKVYIWTYPGKAMGKAAMVGIPAIMHRHNGKYFQMVKDYIKGVFLEEETDFFIFTHLNDYVFSHVAWNNDIDVDALLDKYYTGMYGAGAPMMKEYFNTVEDLWCNKILGNVKNTSLGPIAVIPDINLVWKEIYSQEKMDRLNALLDQAETAASDDPECLARIRYMRQEFHGPIVAARNAHFLKTQGFKQWKAALGEEIFLRPCKGVSAEVSTRVTLTEDAEKLYLDVVCQEPQMATIRAKCPASDRDGNCWEDSDFEFFIAPTGDRAKFYQIVFNSRGSLLDSAYDGDKEDLSWDSQAVVETHRGQERWRAKVTIPKSALGGVDFSQPIPVNFGRHRVTKKIDELYQWSPSEGNSFKETARWGTISNTPAENLLINGDFNLGFENTRPTAWNPWKSQTDDLAKDVTLDNEIFITSGAALRIINTPNVRCAVGQTFRGKANTKYTLSYYIRAQGLDLTGVEEPNSAGVGAYIYAGGKQFGLPQNRIQSDLEWTRQEFTFSTDDKDVDADGTVKCTLGLWNWYCGGTVWFDNVSITECKE